MTTVELLLWLIIGGTVGLLAGTFRRNEGITWTRLLTLSMVGAVVGGLVGQTVFVPDSSTGAESPAGLMIAVLGSVVALLVARAQLRNRERKRFS